MSPSPNAPPPLEAPLPTLSAWTGHFLHAEIPVLAQTAEALEALRAHEDEDAVDANLLGETVAGDPLMSLKILAHVGTHRRGRVDSDPETVIAALVLLGIGPFFRSFGPQPTVEDRLSGRPEALAGLQRVLTRANRAARFALGFGIHRMDHDAAILHQAALLHDFAEMLLWCHAPALALRIQQRKASQPGLRSTEAQREVLGLELADLQQALMRAWRLPEMLVRITDDRHADDDQVRSVMLAVRLARHTADGWEHPALQEDVAELATLLNLGAAPTRQLLENLEL